MRGSENAGMSSANPGENPGHRKSKVSYATLFGVGLVGPKLRPKGASDGQRVNIPVPPSSRFKAKGGTRKGRRSVPIGHGAFSSVGHAGIGKSVPALRAERGENSEVSSGNSVEPMPPRKASLLWDAGARTANRHW